MHFELNQMLRYSLLLYTETGKATCFPFVFPIHFLPHDLLCFTHGSLGLLRFWPYLSECVLLGGASKDIFRLVGRSNLQ